MSTKSVAIWPRCKPIDDPDSALEREVSATLAAMSLERKVGQMIMAELQHVSVEDVAAYHLGAVLNGGGSTPGADKHASVATWAAHAKAFHEASVLGDEPIVPIIWGTDAVHGHNNVVGATIFPHNIGLGAARNPGLIERIGEITAVEVAATGIHWTFAPTVAVARDDRWGRTYEAYSEDPELVEEYAPYMVRGLQGEPGTNGFLAGGRVVATAKHFIGDGGTEQGIDQGDNLAEEAELARVHGPGHFAALDAGAQTVMVTFNSWQGQKVHGHRYLLTSVLKNQIGFDGIVVTDWNGFGQVDGCSNQSCAIAINAGVDMLMAPEDWRELWQNTLAQVRAGEIAESRIDDAVTRILRVKLRANLTSQSFDRVRPLTVQPDLVGCAEHREVARQAVRESLVVLKNRDGLLPLRPSMHILVAGEGADDIGMQCGGWTLSWQGDDNHNSDFPGATSIVDGLRQAVGVGDGDGNGGSIAFSPDGSFVDRPDVAVVVFGEPPYAEGFGDRRDLSHSAECPGDLALLQRLRAQGIPVVSVLLTGRPMWANPEINASDAFVVAWLPGSEGAGISDVLIGDADGKPRFDAVGRLSFSWPADALQTTVNRYDDQEPLFAYGYGLSLRGNLGELDPLASDLPETDSSVQLHNDEQSMTLFRGKPMAPLGLFVGDRADWQVPVRGWQTDSANGAVTVTTVDGEVQGDARRVVWHGNDDGQVYLHAANGIDLTHLAEQGAALRMRVRVEQQPAGKLWLRMDSTYPRHGAVDLTDTLAVVPLHEWLELSLNLEEFATRGANLRRVDTPFLLWSDAPACVSFADVRIAGGGGAAEEVRFIG